MKINSSMCVSVNTAMVSKESKPAKQFKWRSFVQIEDIHSRVYEENQQKILNELYR